MSTKRQATEYPRRVLYAIENNIELAFGYEFQLNRCIKHVLSNMDYNFGCYSENKVWLLTLREKKIELGFE